MTGTIYLTSPSRSFALRSFRSRLSSLLFAHDTDDDDALFLAGFPASLAPRLPPEAFLGAALFFEDTPWEDIGGVKGWPIKVK